MSAKMNDFDKLINDIENTYGKGTASVPTDVEVIPHPSVGFNVLVGIHGVPLGKILEFYGPEHGGKTMMALLAIVNANKEGKRCAFIDLEAALDKTWAAKLGVNWELTTYIRPPSGEKAFDIMAKLVQSGFFSLIVFDSVAAIVSEVELKSEIEDTKDRVGGYAAKIMGAGLRKLVKLLTDHKVAAIFINQVRDKLGTMYGETETTPGGRALKFYASIRIRVNKLTKKDAVYIEHGIQIGHKCNIRLKKNKLGAPDARTAEFDLYYETGIDQISEIIDWLHILNLASKRGDTITYENNKYTLAAFASKLVSDESFKLEMINKIYQNSRGSSTETVEDEPITLNEGLE